MKEVVHHDITEFDYVNWKGEKSKRQAEVNEYHYGSNEYHPEPQWLMSAYDLDKKALRTFALKDMSNVRVIK